jgi:hypothetical protein
MIRRIVYARHKPGELNGLEKAYASLLEARRLAGEILRYDFEPVALRLANRTTYTPDFRVILSDLREEYHEVKGFLRDDAWVKLKIAAELHPYAFFLCRREKGQWQIEEVK